MKSIDIKTILSSITEEYSVLGRTNNIEIDHPASLEEANARSMIWISPKRENKEKTLVSNPAPVIICDQSVELVNEKELDKCVIVVENPRLTYSRLIGKLFKSSYPYTIHKTAIIDPEA